MFSLNDIEFNLDYDSEVTCSNKEKLDNIKAAVAADSMFRKPISSLIMENVSRIDPDICTSLLTPSTNQIRNTPIILKANNNAKKVAVKRKFPGPAGLLPDKVPQFLNVPVPELIETEENSVSEPANILCSQTSELSFLEPPFKKLREDFKMEDFNSPLNTFTVEWVKKKTFSKTLKGQRIPFLALVLQSVDCSSADPVITLRDPTGELHGVLHRDAWKEMGEQLRPGAALVVKEVGVLGTGVSRRHVMVNITKNNIVTIYSPCEESGVIVNSVQPTSNADVLNGIKEWQARAAQLSSPAPSRNPQNSPSSSRALPNLFPNFNLTPTSTKKTFNPNKNHQNQTKSNADLLNASQSSNFDLSFDSIEVPNLDHDEIIVNSLEKNKDIKLKSARVVESNSIVLSQAETSMLDEVLSGVDLDDFDGM